MLNALGTNGLAKAQTWPLRPPTAALWRLRGRASHGVRSTEIQTAVGTSLLHLVYTVLAAVDHVRLVLSLLVVRVRTATRCSHSEFTVNLRDIRLRPEGVHGRQHLRPPFRTLNPTLGNGLP